MKTVVVSQPMFFPWVGLLEQIRLADVFIHYDDVQLPMGRSFMVRVQVKAPEGVRWLTVPIRREAGQLIKDVRTDDQQDWRRKHLATLANLYAKSPYVQDMLALVEDIYRGDCNWLADLNTAATERTAEYFGISADYYRSSLYPTPATSSAHLLELVRRFDGDVYVTGHGARNYLDHGLFAAHGTEVRYMQYECQPYQQLHGTFTPYVSALDLIANCGRDGAKCIRSGSVNWKEFLR